MQVICLFPDFIFKILNIFRFDYGEPKINVPFFTFLMIFNHFFNNSNHINIQRKNKIHPRICNNCQICFRQVLSIKWSLFYNQIIFISCQHMFNQFMVFLDDCKIRFKPFNHLHVHWHFSLGSKPVQLYFLMVRKEQRVQQIAPREVQFNITQSPFITQNHHHIHPTSIL